MEEHLKNCPFCKDEMELRVDSGNMEYAFHTYCHADCPITDARIYEIDLWNKRETPTLVPLDKNEVAQHLLFMLFSNHPDLKNKVEALRISKIICAKFGQQARNLVPLDKEKLYVFLKKISVGSWSLDNMAQLIADEFSHPARKEISVDWNEIESLVSLKLKQMLVDDSPDRLGYTKSKIIIEAIKQYIDGMQTP